ncbi:MAG: hypothetical protein QM315_06385 [Bacillota bacterium]|jgi:hypothetical protein|nr:hypothetical protein [Bacillota bacterium]
MNKNKRVLFIVIAFICVTAAFTAAHAAATSAQPGSEFDPLVTKSYVDEQIQKLSQKIGSGSSGSARPSTGTGSGSVDEQVINNLRTDVSDLTSLIIEAYMRIQSLEKQNMELIRKVEELEQGFTVVEAAKGQRILLGAGAEVIVRSGEALAVQGELGGLADVTAAKDLTGGMQITNQHLLISSRKDGRGLQVVSDVVFLLIRGGYTIE